MTTVQQRRAARRSTMPEDADVVDVDDPASTDLLHEQRQRLLPLLHENAFHLPATDVEINPYSLPGTPLYERFVAARAQLPDKSMRLFFHGTPETNVKAICRDGLDPKLRRAQALGPGEYFSGKPRISVKYCQGGSKMLVFCILMDPSGVTQFHARPDGGGVAVIHKPEHQLPLAVVTFDPAKIEDVAAPVAPRAAGVPRSAGPRKSGGSSSAPAAAVAKAQPTLWKRKEERRKRLAEAAWKAEAATKRLAEAAARATAEIKRMAKAEREDPDWEP